MLFSQVMLVVSWLKVCSETDEIISFSNCLAIGNSREINLYEFPLSLVLQGFGVDEGELMVLSAFLVGVG